MIISHCRPIRQLSVEVFLYGSVSGFIRNNLNDNLKGRTVYPVVTVILFFLTCTACEYWTPQVSIQDKYKTVIT